jgi:hypothetical protein
MGTPERGSEEKTQEAPAEETMLRQMLTGTQGSTPEAGLTGVIGQPASSGMQGARGPLVSSMVRTSHRDLR